MNFYVNEFYKYHHFICIFYIIEHIAMFTHITIEFKIEGSKWLMKKEIGILKIPEWSNSILLRLGFEGSISVA